MQGTDIGRTGPRIPPKEKNAELIALVKKSETPVPWCDEFENMISGLR